MLVQGPMVLLIAFGALVVLWLIVLAISPLFGPKD